FVAVFRRLVADDRHQPLLGILFFHEVLADIALDAPAQEQASAGFERVVGEGILGPEQLAAESESGADETPRSGDFADERSAGFIDILDRRAREVLRWTFRIVDLRTHALAELGGVFRARPLEAVDVSRYLHRTHAVPRLAGFGQEEAGDFHAVA